MICWTIDSGNRVFRLTSFEPTSAARKRRLGRSLAGFSLVELLVVITLIGILIAMLLPAVQGAREAARRLQCSNNLKQLGLAVTSYEQIHSVLPAGAYCCYDSTSTSALNRGNVLLHIMPFMEQQALYDRFDFNKQVDDQVIPGTGKYLGTTVIPLFLCPSDQPAKISWVASGLARANYLASAGPSAGGEAAGITCSLNATWNSVCRVGESGDPRTPNAGPFHRNCYHTPLTRIIDGLSNTIFFGETRPACSACAQFGWVISNNCQGSAYTQVPINFASCSTTSTDCYYYHTFTSSHGFKSCHPGGAQFLFGDGAVRFVPETIDYRTYQYLGDMADGKAVSLSW